MERGLDVSQGVLGVIDGSKGLRKAVEKVFAGRARRFRSGFCSDRVTAGRHGRLNRYGPPQYVSSTSTRPVRQSRPGRTVRRADR